MTLEISKLLFEVADCSSSSSSSVNYYAGIGSRSAPQDTLSFFEALAVALADEKYILRSGGAEGADSAFEFGAISCDAEIYLPGKSFNGRYADGQTYFDCTKLHNWSEAISIAKHYHPAPHNLSAYALKLMARNSYQVLGLDLETPSNFLVCWTPNGKEIGGTSQAIRIAKDHGIKIFNFGNEELIAQTNQKLRDYISCAEDSNLRKSAISLLVNYGGS